MDIVTETMSLGTQEEERKKREPHPHLHRVASLQRARISNAMLCDQRMINSSIV